MASPKFLPVLPSRTPGQDPDDPIEDSSSSPEHADIRGATRLSSRGNRDPATPSMQMDQHRRSQRSAPRQTAARSFQAFPSFTSESDSRALEDVPKRLESREHQHFVSAPRQRLDQATFDRKPPIRHFLGRLLLASNLHSSTKALISLEDSGNPHRAKVLLTYQPFANRLPNPETQSSIAFTMHHHSANPVECP